jgi:hypothetical protein
MNRFATYLWALGLLALPFVTSCGGATVSQRPDARPDAQREMQAQEERLHDAELALDEAGAPCEQRCHAGGSICDAARHICEIARDLGDERSAERCTRAESSCTEASARIAECHCDADAADAGQACNGPARTTF